MVSCDAKWRRQTVSKKIKTANKYRKHGAETIATNTAEDDGRQKLLDQGRIQSWANRTAASALTKSR